MRRDKAVKTAHNNSVSITASVARQDQRFLDNTTAVHKYSLSPSVSLSLRSFSLSVSFCQRCSILVPCGFIVTSLFPAVAKKEYVTLQRPNQEERRRWVSHGQQFAYATSPNTKIYRVKYYVIYKAWRNSLGKYLPRECLNFFKRKCRHVPSQAGMPHGSVPLGIRLRRLNRPPKTFRKNQNDSPQFSTHP